MEECINYVCRNALIKNIEECHWWLNRESQRLFIGFLFTKEYLELRNWTSFSQYIPLFFFSLFSNLRSPLLLGFVWKLNSDGSASYSGFIQNRNISQIAN